MLIGPVCAGLWLSEWQLQSSSSNVSSPMLFAFVILARSKMQKLRSIWLSWHRRDRSREKCWPYVVLDNHLTVHILLIISKNSFRVNIYSTIFTKIDVKCDYLHLKTHLCYISVAFVFCYDELWWDLSFVFAPFWFPIGFHHFDSSLLCWRTQQPRKVFLEQQQSMTKEFQSHRNRRSFVQVQVIWLVILQINPHTRKISFRIIYSCFLN